MRPLLLLGASVRALAYSAHRAGFAPHGIDLFADQDLRRLCPARQLCGRYPQAFLDALDEEETGPWMYTGGLENWPGVVDRLAQRLPLWGNTGEALRQIRDPWNVARLLRENDLPVLRLDRKPPGSPDDRFLVKPLRGAGGTGIHFADPSASPGGMRAPVYYQEYALGEPVAAIFVSDGRVARLLGVTRQLVGESWLGAAPFHYCGSIGPINSGASWWPTVEQVGQVLAAGCGLRGMFGVDGIVREGTFWTVEVNPRYTASVEVLEHATGVQAVREHAAVFLVSRDAQRIALGGERAPLRVPANQVGKAILFARQPVTFPEAGPWNDMLRSPVDPLVLPAFADLPAAGERIETGRPILTLFAQAETPGQCQAELQRVAGELERVLYP